MPLLPRSAWIAESETPCKERNGLCLECHGEQGRSVARSHTAVTQGKGCLSCHMPHAAKNKDFSWPRTRIFAIPATRK